MNKKILLGTMVTGLAVGAVIGLQTIRSTDITSADTEKNNAKSDVQVMDVKNEKVQITESHIEKGLASIRAFRKDMNAKANYRNTSWNPYYNIDPSGKPEAQTMSFVDSEGWLYTVAVDTNKIIQVGPTPRQSLDETSPARDFTARYSKEDLQKYAVGWLKDRGINVNEAAKGLEFSVGTKDGKGYFFRWVDRGDTEKTRFLQVGFTIGGSLLSYTNTL